METCSSSFQKNCLTCVVERPDGTTYCQDIADDFYALLDFKKSLGKKYWIVEIF